MADDVRLAARRFGFTRRSNVHPADSIDDPRLAAAGVAAAIAEIAGPMTAAQIQVLATQSRIAFRASEREAADIAAFGRWIAGQCGAPEEAARRLVKVVRGKAGSDVGPDLVDLVEAVADADGAARTERQDAAISRVRAAFEH